ncbi:hypothetical protein [Caldimonas brevitalea]|uniref:DNA alkylation repair enzyme n=1 Tax=Caldimonas brevitalea TaxID=413882 RepID=A0A0G3BC58_9BURK|nr:hypothetical protein [Caldimonas brevitalea]AKJ26949.1 DNA alkylation repair enzyme [Caldimonas brevitalea]
MPPSRPNEIEPAPLLKDGFNAATVAGIARDVAAVHPGFDTSTFVQTCLEGFEACSLMQRVGRVAAGLQRCLPADYRRALPLVLGAMEVGAGSTLPARDGGMAAFRFAPHLQYVAEAGLEHPELSLDALAQMTRHFTGEFAIRAFLDRWPTLTLERLRRWCDDADPRVRRLVSEGTRPLLPWARRVALLSADPGLALPLLDRLVDDADEVVRRSVANHLNDVSRLRPDLALQAAQRWRTAAPRDIERTLRRALRTLVKQGDAGALRLLGFAADHAVALQGLQLHPTALQIGQTLDIAFSLESLQPLPGSACVDYAVHYVGANGKPRRKVFKGAECVLQPGFVAAFVLRRDFSPRSTRRLYPGTHRVDILVNGRVLGSASFELR